ncbi:Uma2 family endonuclease [uncultured Methylobacterium sp.]|uniref:Uma2 family endonuclease n=1 Tax=uncultured Methylobacterium sp. TaxID=157278 RepID=UPI0026284D31|nr:Uma2 family endonuclease [uncultured Methylobacterium sp.]
MTVDEFLAWSQTVPGRHELVAGEVVAMAPERVRHAITKFAVQSALHRALGRLDGSCRMLPDGVTVRIDEQTAFEPDALVSCGAILNLDAIEAPNPVIVVEVLSPGTRSVDKGKKLSGYFQVASIAHYLLVDPVNRSVTHYRRDGEQIASAIMGQGTLDLDPPGITVPVADLFG